MAERVLSRVGASATAAVVQAGRARVPTAARALSAIPHNITGASGLAPRPIPSPLMDARASKPAPAVAAQGSSATATVARDAAAASRTAVPPAGAPATATPDDVAATSSGMVDVTEVIATPYSRPSHAYQCAVHVPANFQRRELGQLFYGLDKAAVARMSVVTVALRAHADMANWSGDIREERELLTKEFHTLAARAVDNLRAAGYWADYIDPTSGKAHLAASSRGTLLETDDRMETFGFQVKDFGCCKAVAHPEWGTHVMVGVVCTDAPHEIVTRLAAIVTADSPPVPTAVLDATTTASAAVAATAAPAASLE